MRQVLCFRRDLKSENNTRRCAGVESGEDHGLCPLVAMPVRCSPADDRDVGRYGLVGQALFDGCEKIGRGLPAVIGNDLGQNTDRRGSDDKLS